MKYRIFFVLALITTLRAETGFAQEADSAQTEDASRIDFVVISTKFKNAFTFLGRDFGETIPFFNVDAMYLFQNGLYFNLGAFKFLDTDIPFQYAATLGYQKDIGKRTVLQSSYSQYFISDISDVVGIQNLGMLEVAVGLDWDVLYSTLQLQAFLNDRPDFFVGTTHSRYFQFDQKLFNLVRISFVPTIELLMGTNNFYRMGSFDESQLQVLSADTFNFLSTEASIPIIFEMGGWEVEFEPRYVSPLNTPNFDASVNRFVFSIGISHSLPIYKKK